VLTRSLPCDEVLPVVRDVCDAGSVDSPRLGFHVRDAALCCCIKGVLESSSAGLPLWGFSAAATWILTARAFDPAVSSKTHRGLGFGVLTRRLGGRLM
jgi:hypothetical protein